MPLLRPSFCLLLLCLGLAAPVAAQVVNPLFSESFADDISLLSWSPGGSFDNGAVKITSKGTTVTTVIRHLLPANELAGRIIRVSARMKSAGVSTPPASYNGVKLRLDLTSSDGKRTHFQAPVTHAENSDWKLIEFSRAIPTDLTECSIALGIERVEGSVWFDDVKVEIIR